jgi:pimeloyl-ACP methyl ester carboxylesterase
MPTFEHDGISFNYLDEGDPSGLPFLFQHGLGGDLNQPSSVFSLPEGVRLLSMDCRGHGQTRPLGHPEKLSFDAFADDVAALMDHLGLESAVAGGISMGAGVALNLALRHPQRVRGLVLVRPAWLDGPMPEGNAKIYSYIASLIRERGPEAGREEFLRSDTYARVQEQSPAGAASLVAEFDNPRAEEVVDVYERIPASFPVQNNFDWERIPVPTLVLANLQDPLHPFEYGKELARSIPGARFAELTPKSVDEERHGREVQHHAEKFLSALVGVATSTRAAGSPDRRAEGGTQQRTDEHAVHRGPGTGPRST